MRSGRGKNKVKAQTKMRPDSPLVKIWWLPPWHFYDLLIPDQRVSKQTTVWPMLGLLSFDYVLHLVWTDPKWFRPDDVRWCARKPPGGADHFRPVAEALRYHQGARDAGHHLRSNSFETDREETFICTSSWILATLKLGLRFGARTLARSESVS